MKIIERLVQAFGVAGAVAIMLLPGLGQIYWLWTAIQLGSFFMFFLGCLPHLFPVTGTIGAYAFFFGVPDWMVRWFG